MTSYGCAGNVNLVSLLESPHARQMARLPDCARIAHHARFQPRLFMLHKVLFEAYTIRASNMTCVKQCAIRHT